MNGIYSKVVSRKNLRRVVAAVFVLVLLAEWGSHSFAYSHTSSVEGITVSAKEGEHEDPCKTLVRCTDGRRQDQKVSNPGHDLSQHNAFFDQLARSRRLDGIFKDLRTEHAAVNELFRPISPPFHPPELS